jgi:hypothetical protein
LIWARTTNNYLISPEKTANVIEKKSGSLEIGDYVSITNVPLKYVGQFYFTALDHNYERQQSWPSWPYKSEERTRYIITLVPNPKKVWVFQDSSGNFTIYKSSPKYNFINNVPLDFSLPTGEFVFAHQKNSYNIGGYFFTSANDQKNFNASFDKIKEAVIKSEKWVVENDKYEVLYQNREISLTD